MQRALYLLGRFDIDTGPALSISATAAVVAATDHADKEGRCPMSSKGMVAVRSMVNGESGRNGVGAALRGSSVVRRRYR